MRTSKLRKVGGSTYVALPQAMLDQLGLAAGAEVSVTVENDRFIVQRKSKGRIGLKARLAMCDFTIPISDEEREWLDAPAVGDEVI